MNNFFNGTKFLQRLYDISHTKFYGIVSNLIYFMESMDEEYFVSSFESGGFVSEFICFECYSGCFYIEGGYFFVKNFKFAISFGHLQSIPTTIFAHNYLSFLYVLNSHFTQQKYESEGAVITFKSNN